MFAAGLPFIIYLLLLSAHAGYAEVGRKPLSPELPKAGGAVAGYEIIGVANIGEVDWLIFSLPLFRSEVKFSMVFYIGLGFQDSPWHSNV